MRSSTFLSTRVARRMLGLFLLCALFPAIALALLGYSQVTGHLREQSVARLQEASKSAGMILIERLQMAESAFRTAAGLVARDPSGLHHFGRNIEEPRIGALLLATPEGRVRMVRDTLIAQLPSLTFRQNQHMADGGTVITSVPGAVLMARHLVPGDPSRGVLWGQVQEKKLWGPPSDNETGPDLCVIGSRGEPLHCPAPARQPGAPAAEYVAASWTAFLGYQWAAESWTVELSQSRASIVAPVSRFLRTFLTVMLLVLVVVFLVSNSQIRRQLEPLARLQRGTGRLARGEFTDPVIVSSGDEFEELADSFNRMARQVGRQVQTLTTYHDISTAALSEVRAGRLCTTIVERIEAMLPGSRAVLLLADEGPDSPWSGIARDRAFHSRQPPSALKETHARLLAPGQSAATAEWFPGIEPGYVLCHPLTDHRESIGALLIAFPGSAEPSADEHERASRVSGQVAMALANTRMVERLDLLSSGTLSALARTVDANSPWTAGHSERVTQLSLLLGRELGLTARELDTVQRGGLLHDIGKVGVPAALLDKPGRLTDEEMQVVQAHPATGARILAPIAVFADILPIVRHHHERMDGSGYPDRLAGEEIHPLARVVAVADVYDALVSDRPYRAGWTPEDALRLIQSTAGAHHDPVMVQAFLRIHAKGLVRETAARVALPMVYSGDAA